LKASRRSFLNLPRANPNDYGFDTHGGIQSRSAVSRKACRNRRWNAGDSQVIGNRKTILGAILSSGPGH